MGATVWTPLEGRYDQVRWLSVNGKTAKAPPIEISGSGRRVRIAGTKQSQPYDDLDQLLDDYVRGNAFGGDAIWLRLEDRPLPERCGWSKVRPEINLRKGGRTISDLWWAFRDTEYGLEAGIEVCTYMPYGSVKQVTVLHVPDTRPGSSSGELALHHREYFGSTVNSPGWDLVGQKEFDDSRSILVATMRLIRQINAIDALEVPDLRNGPYHSTTAPTIGLELVDTNVTDEFISELADLLAVEPLISEAAGLMERVHDILLRVGISVTKPEDSYFMQAFLAGPDKPVVVPVSTALLEDDRTWATSNNRRSSDHQLYLHIPTGTFAVQCPQEGHQTAKVAQAWEEAHAIASLTGKEDELLAYAREYAAREVKDRVAKKIAERKIA